MVAGILYALVGAALFGLGLYALIMKTHLFRRILALNVMGSGTFLILVGAGRGSGGVHPDAVPQAMVITGIVVAVSATALALTLMLRLAEETGRAELPEE
ncbi:MAG: NADH-quinone oxidoreductase subunit K [Salinisphaera sp.]|uniref:sodium:proton antiporter n=1 Tax=Salinisphaera sp. TaxID=1914330 RepID=UPI003C7CC89D